MLGDSESLRRGRRWEAGKEGFLEEVGLVLGLEGPQGVGMVGKKGGVWRRDSQGMQVEREQSLGSGAKEPALLDGAPLRGMQDHVCFQELNVCPGPLPPTWG